jgi:hypothetical protein
MLPSETDRDYLLMFFATCAAATFMRAAQIWISA